MYESSDFDNSKFSHSLFGDDSFARERDFQTFVTTNELPYDCFWDETGDVKYFFVDQTGEIVWNEVYAIMPNGMMIKYNFMLDGDFEDWAHSMYQLAYPN